jgi:hypothetical protein
LFVLHPPPELPSDSSELQVEYAKFNIAAVTTLGGRS